MKTLIALLLWFLLLVVCWPLAIIVFFVFPIFWLLLLPFRILGFSLDLVFQVVKGIVLLPFRIIKAV